MGSRTQDFIRYPAAMRLDAWKELTRTARSPRHMALLEPWDSSPRVNYSACQIAKTDFLSSMHAWRSTPNLHSEIKRFGAR